MYIPIYIYPQFYTSFILNQTLRFIQSPLPFAKASPIVDVLQCFITVKSIENRGKQSL